MQIMVKWNITYFGKQMDVLENMNVARFGRKTRYVLKASEYKFISLSLSVSLSRSLSLSSSPSFSLSLPVSLPLFLHPPPLHSSIFLSISLANRGCLV